ncbi:MAG: hypothetical protein IOD12_04040 [Silvanigrellales bacterium]|nr:hypothetical protein [Silvanigrellales bacterium]
MSSVKSALTNLLFLCVPGVGLWGCWPNRSGDLPPSETGDAEVRYEARVAPAHPLRDSVLQCFVAGLGKEFEPLVRYSWRNGTRAVGKDAASLAPRFFAEGDSVTCQASFRTDRNPVRLDSKPVVIPRLTLKALKPSNVKVAGRVSPLTGKVIATANDVLTFETAAGLEYHKCSFDEARWSKCASGTTKLAELGGWSELKEGEQSLFVRGVYYTYESGSQVVAFEKENATPEFDPAGSQLLRAGAPVDGSTLSAGQDAVFLPRGVDPDGDALSYNIRVVGLDTNGTELFLRSAAAVKEFTLGRDVLLEGVTLHISVSVADSHGRTSSEVTWKSFVVSADPTQPTPTSTPVPTPAPEPQRWLQSNAAFTLAEDGALRLVFTEGVAFHAGAAEVERIALRVVANPTQGTVGVASCAAGACSIDYVPTPHFFGSDSLSVVLESDLGTTAALPVTLSVINSDDAPTGTLACSPQTQSMKKGITSRVVTCSGVFDSLDAEAVAYEPVPEENECGFVAEAGSSFRFLGLTPLAASETCVTRFRARDTNGTFAASTATVSLVAVDKAMTFSTSVPLSISKTCRVELQGAVAFDLAGASYANASASGGVCLTGVQANASGFLGAQVDGALGACEARWLVTDSFGITEGVSYTVTPTSVGETDAPVPLEWPVALGADVGLGNQPVLCGSGCSGARALLSSGPSARTQCALGDDGLTRCWGSGVSGQLAVSGTEATTALASGGGSLGAASFPVTGLQGSTLGPVENMAGIAAGASHTCFLLQDGTVRCAGNTESNAVRLGAACAVGDTLCPVALSNAVSLASGADFTCAMVTSGRVTSLKCFGAGDKGQLGNMGVESGLNTVNASATHRTSLSRRQAVDVQFLATDRPLAFSTGAEHACALVNNTLAGKTEARCWGANTHRQLGFNNLSPTTGVPLGAVALVPLPVDMTQIDQSTPTSPVGIAAAAQHTCLLMDSGRVACWGDNLHSQLGIDYNFGIGFRPRPVTTNSASPPPEGNGYVPGFDGVTHKAIALAAGKQHTCALTNNGVIRCWGANAKGQLGIDPVTYPTLHDAAVATVSAPDASLFVAVSAGEEHTCGATRSGRTYCWGEGQNGRLGDAGAVATVSTPTHVPVLVRQAASPLLDFVSASRTCSAHHSFAVSAPSDVPVWPTPP